MNRSERKIRNELLEKGFKEGISSEELAVKHNMKRYHVLMVLRKIMGKDYKLYLKRKPRKTGIQERNKSIVNDYLGNLTFDQLTEKYGIKHERIRQIVVKTMGDKYKNMFKENIKLKTEQDLEKFMKLAKELGRIPSSIEFKSNGIKSYTHHSYFRKTAKQAGYKYIKQIRKKTISNEQLISDLKQLALTLGRTPTKGDLATIKPNLSVLYFRRFGGMGNAQKLAGLAPNRKGFNKFTHRLGPHLVTKQQCIDDFKNIYSRFGRKPTYDEVRVYGKYGISTYSKYLGKYDKVWAKIIKGKI